MTALTRPLAYHQAGEIVFAGHPVTRDHAHRELDAAMLEVRWAIRLGNMRHLEEAARDAQAWLRALNAQIDWRRAARVAA